MLNGTQSELVIKLNELFESAKVGNEDFLNKICNLLISFLQLETVVLFEFDTEDSLSVLSRGHNAKKNFTVDSKHSCPKCKLFLESVNYSQFSDPDCHLQISEFLVYENCVLLIISPECRILIKMAKKSVFTKIDKDSIDNIMQLINPYWIIWLQSKGSNISLPNSTFSKIVTDASNELRTSVNSIIGYLSILSEQNNSGVNNDYVTAIKSLPPSGRPHRPPVLPTLPNLPNQNPTT